MAQKNLIKTSKTSDPFEIYLDPEEGVYRSKETMNGNPPIPEPQLRNPEEEEYIPEERKQEPYQDLIPRTPEAKIKNWRDKNFTPYLEPTGTIDFDDDNPSYNPDVNQDDPPMSEEQADQELVDWLHKNPESLYDTLKDFYNGYGPQFDQFLPKEMFDIPGAEDLIDQIKQDDQDVTSGRPVIRKAK